MGPVPSSFYEEWDAPELDLAAAIDVVPGKIIDDMRERVVLKIAYDDNHFTKRELRIMEVLAPRFRNSLSTPMIEVTHQELGPWAMIWDDGRGEYARIPYRLALAPDDPRREAILASVRVHASIESAQFH